ncbi:glycosyltransferase family 4 protein [Alkalihalobacterium chitinilyticum]|uniref:Glycosyltransferase family 4 protein n=1 Tax=Alkalihalobacterium chitinilyticum TaxID=2980103 RepID=A0ABT5VBP3_9BACI|nr:glycosyltransferase family 4 protein [Alkalihalobacterium chitinilyticum]MDE5412695.1 glycosyltransferase family 4 protein [Alkalihalobacterium chitinilyticum]
MKVLMICTEKLPVPPVRGGAIQTYIAGVSDKLSSHYELTILGRDDLSLPNEEKIKNVKYVRVPGGLFEIYKEGVIDYLKTNTFDVIHIFNRPRLVTSVREVAPNSRLVLSMHNDMFKPEKIDHEEAEKAIEQLDKIITVSDYIGRTIAEPFPQAASKLKTIYSGVDIERFAHPHSDQARKMRKQIRQEHNLEDKKIILFTGRLSANKGADILVKAMPKLAEKHPDIALVIVGSKWFSQDDITDYVAYVRALANRLPIPVITTGFVAPDQIQYWFAAADIFVCPSQWQEPLARVHYEAMASGRPIVTTARGGNPEVIEEKENGIVIQNPEDPQEFADQISFLLSSPNSAKKMGEYGRSLAEKNYTWSRVADDILSVWNEIENKIKNNISVNALEEDVSNTEMTEIEEDMESAEAMEAKEDMETAETTEAEEDMGNLDMTEPEEDIRNTEATEVEEDMDNTESTETEEDGDNEESIDGRESAKVDPSSTVEILEENPEMEEVEERTKAEVEPNSQKTKSKKERIREILFSELTKSNQYIKSLMSAAEEKMENSKDSSENEMKNIIKSVVAGVEEQFDSEQKQEEVQEQEEKLEKPSNLVEAVNDITTAKLFMNVVDFNRNKKRRKKSS